MSDRPHLHNEQELYNYFNNYGQSNDSNTTTSSTSSPIISISQTGFNWYSQSTTSNFDYVAVNPRHDYNASQRHLWSSPQPQQHHYMVHHHSQQQQAQLMHQQQRQYYQSMSYRSTPVMQTSYGESYRHYRMDNNELMRYHSDTAPQLEAPVEMAATDIHETNLYDGYQQHNIIPTSEMSNTSKYLIPSDDELSNVENESKILEIIELSPSQQKTPSPKSTPVPSPIISSKKRKRRNGDNSRRNSISNEERLGEKRSRAQQRVEVEEGACNVLKEGDFNKEIVDQIENELAFLGDEFATIDIMLDSLRNAFITDVSTITSSSKKSALVPLIGTINFMENDTNLIHNSINQQVFVMKNSPHRSMIMAQNPEMEREMRTAYDDLTLQVRQVEKKLERLEHKSRKVLILVNIEAKRRKALYENKKEQERYSQISKTSNNSNNCSSNGGASK